MARRKLTGPIRKRHGRFGSAPIESTGPRGAKGPRKFVPKEKGIVEPRNVPHMPIARPLRPAKLKIVRKRGVRRA